MTARSSRDFVILIILPSPLSVPPVVTSALTRICEIGNGKMCEFSNTFWLSICYMFQSSFYYSYVGFINRETQSYNIISYEMCGIHLRVRYVVFGLVFSQMILSLFLQSKHMLYDFLCNMQKAPLAFCFVHWYFVQWCCVNNI